MKDDSAEWMAQFKASGQLWPVPHEGTEVTEDARQQDLGMVIHPNARGQQVLGTCSPGRWLIVKAAVRHLLLPSRLELTEDEQQSADEQTRVRTAWIRDHSRQP